MKFLITEQPGQNSTQPDPDASFDEALVTKYMKFNEEMHKAGVLVAAEGLNPAGKGARIEVKNGKRVVVDGPFTESKELVGGFYILEVASLDEAIQWALRSPTGLGFDDVLQIRQLTGEDDVPPRLLELIKEVAPTWSATFVKR
ncbi:MAG TPA: YciI family protein [Vicinamibacterales bacterium]|nr:YciI family protein [Vicinamibacterales bacterium]